MATVEANYETRDLARRILQALTDEGIDIERLTPEILAPMDHLHTRGLPATLDHIKLIDFTSDTRVLDLGCGIGGPARFLADRFGCHVTGIDLMPEYIAAGRMLTARCGLENLVELRQGNALDLPFDDGAFDVVWSQNVAMNIADKAALYAEVHRVLAPGGKFTFTDYLSGPGGPAIYPTVWARDPAVSFIIPEAEMNALLADAGFRITRRIDDGEAIREAAKNATRSRRPSGGNLTPRIVFGDDTGNRVANAQRNVLENRLVYLRVVAERAD